MSLHTDLFAAPARVWPTDIATALGLGSPLQVYVGRRRQRVSRLDCDVWIEPVDGVEDGAGAQDVAWHVYDVHLRTTSNAGAEGTGVAQVDTIRAHMRTLVDRYHGRKPAGFNTVVDLVSLEATERSVDADPEDARVLDGVVRVRFLVAAGAVV